MGGLAGIAASGLVAHQRQIDLIANDIANVNTVAYKQSRVRLQDQPYRLLRDVVPDAERAGVTTEWRVGEGVDARGAQRLFWQGDLVETGNPLDLAIVGPGFFRIQLEDGSFGYTRDGSLTIDESRDVVTESGHPIAPPIRAPEGAKNLSIGPDGQVLAEVDGERRELGRIELVTFPNPAGLLAVGRNLYRETAASGAPDSSGGNAVGGELVSGALEGSNVDVAEQMTRLMQAQRAYQVNLKALQTWDELLSQANELQRG